VPQRISEFRLTFRDVHDQNHFRRLDSSDSTSSRRTALTRGPYFCFVLRRIAFQILAWKILTCVFRDFSHDAPRVLPRTLSLIYSPIHYSLIILALDILCSQTLTVLLNNNKYRVIHKTLRDFRTRLRNKQDRHNRKEHISK
jgi:hypothetical protein